MADRTRLELATSAVTGQRSNQTELPVHNQIKNQKIMTLFTNLWTEFKRELSLFVTFCHFLDITKFFLPNFGTSLRKALYNLKTNVKSICPF